MPNTTPNESWTAQIQKYLGENPEQYFSCPSNPSAKGETTYALIQYGNALPTNPDTLLLFELAESVPLDKAVITVEEIIDFVETGIVQEVVCCGRPDGTTTVSRIPTPHSFGTNVAYRSGAVQFISRGIEKEELLRMLGQDEEEPQEEAQE